MVHGQEYEYTAEDIYRSPVRKVLNMFSVTITTGYNSTNYNHDLSGYYYLQSQEQQLITEDLGGPLPADFDVYDNWFNNPGLA